jgi:hypothetical protein
MGTTSPNARKAANGTPVELTWDRPQDLGSLRLDYQHVEGETVCPMPRALLSAFRFEVRPESVAWEKVFRPDDNHKRLALESSRGDKPARIFSLDVAPDGHFASA